MAEIARLRAELDRAPPLPAEVEETKNQIVVALINAAIRASNDEDHKTAKYFDCVRDAAASLLSRWPGGWRPIETAPKDGTAVLLRLKQHFTDNRPDLDRFRGVHFVGRNVGSSMDWCFAAPVGYGGFPDEWFDGWMPIPEPPNE